MSSQSDSPRDSRRQDREVASTVLFYVLTGLVAAFSIWCVVLLSRAYELRRNLDAELAWVEDVRLLRGELERLATGGEAGAGTSADSAEILDRMARRLVARPAAARLEVEVQGLRRALDRLGESLGENASQDAVWAASVAVSGALSALEERVQGRLAELYRRLAGHWTALYLLIVASLLLAASNLALLRLAHRRRRRLERAHGEALRQSTQDPLTHTWNREAILNLLRRELVRAERLRSPVGVILVDVDSFSQVNVLLGQDQGDFVLEQLAARLGKFVRPYDTMGRFGGDSFLIVLPVCDLAATGNVAERLREAINDRDMEHALGRIRVTVSLAYATVDEPEDADADLLIHHLQERIASLQTEGPGRMAQLTS